MLKNSPFSNPINFLLIFSEQHSIKKPTHGLLALSLYSSSLVLDRFVKQTVFNAEKRSTSLFVILRLHNTTTKIPDYTVLVVYRYLNFTRKHQSN